jgi:RNA polymerase sigma-70 factor (ECF subfamily)
MHLHHPNQITGEGEAADVLYERYAAAIFAYLRKHSRSREDAEDILEDIFIAAMENEKFAGLSEQIQVAWLWRVARNKVADAFRRSAVRQNVSLEMVTETLCEDDAQVPEQAASRLDDIALVQQLLQQLSPLQREVMRLRFGDNLRSTEIAATIGKREAAVRAILSRTMNFLRNHVKEGYEESEA